MLNVRNGKKAGTRTRGKEKNPQKKYDGRKRGNYRIGGQKSWDDKCELSEKKRR